ncbi:MAG: GNAT family N-acetyltransferase [Anaerolineales bacterium]|jgi:predicted GNAT superfamily acetyltransferase
MEPILRILETPEEIFTVEDLQKLIWPGTDRDIIPAHLLIAIVQNGGLLIGAFVGGQLIGFVLGFPGLVSVHGDRKLIHASHELGVHPEFRGQGIGFKLKRAQWQMVRHQNIELITWTYDPLMSRNAHLNIARLGAVCNTYARNYYGVMRDELNAGVTSDRFIVNWWVNSRRVENRLSQRARRKLDLAHYLAAEVVIVNPSRLNDRSLPMPSSDITPEMLALLNVDTPNHDRERMFLLEIPSDFQQIRKLDLQIAAAWREHTRLLFETAFANDYLVTDFIYLPGAQPRSFYLFSKGDSTLGGDIT